MSSTLNEGRSVNPGYTCSSWMSVSIGAGSLNEGRSVNPGYTILAAESAWVNGTAQRRPERQPRLHTSTL